jgi:hypothetical protein
MSPGNSRNLQGMSRAYDGTLSLCHVCHVLGAISDRASLHIFKEIAHGFKSLEGKAVENDKQDFGSLTKSEISRKQYYTRLSRMMRTGLITRNHGGYNLTCLGKLAYEVENIIEDTITNHHWKLKALDQLEKETKGFSQENRLKLINTLIDDEKIRAYLLINEKELPA